MVHPGGTDIFGAGGLSAPVIHSSDGDEAIRTPVGAAGCSLGSVVSVLWVNYFGYYVMCVASEREFSLVLLLLFANGDILRSFSFEFLFVIQFIFFFMLTPCD